MWDLDRVAARFEEAANTAHRLPPVKVQGYFSLWPAIKREPWEAYADDEPKRFRFPPDPAAIDRMLETTRWVGWLDEEQRHLVWMRAEGRGWKTIAARFGCDRTTAWRHWQKALGVVARRLNAPGAVPGAGCPASAREAVGAGLGAGGLSPVPVDKPVVKPRTRGIGSCPASRLRRIGQELANGPPRPTSGEVCAGFLGSLRNAA